MSEPREESVRIPAMFHAPPQDAFSSRVWGLRRTYFDIDAPDFENLLATVVSLVLEGCSDEEAAIREGQIGIDPEGQERVRAGVASMMNTFLSILSQRPVSSVGEVAATMIRSWEDWKSSEPDVDSAISKLVGVSYGLGVGVRRDMPGTAERWTRASSIAPDGNAFERNCILAESQLHAERELFERIAQYGATADESMVGDLLQLYSKRLGDLAI